MIVYVFTNDCLRIYKWLFTYLQMIVYVFTNDCLRIYKWLFTYLQMIVYVFTNDCLRIYKLLFTYLQMIVYVFTNDCLPIYKLLFTYLQIIVYVFTIFFTSKENLLQRNETLCSLHKIYFNWRWNILTSNNKNAPREHINVETMLILTLGTIYLRGNRAVKFNPREKFKINIHKNKSLRKFPRQQRHRKNASGWKKVTRISTEDEVENALKQDGMDHQTL